jgi:hypothetical protein
LATAATVVAALAAIVVAFALASSLTRSGPSLTVTSLSVTTTPADRIGHCPSTVFAFRGTISTNGQAGVIRYNWVKPDGSLTPTGEVRVARGESRALVELDFAYNGNGSTTGTAALHVVGPADVYSAPVPVKYQCP